MPKCSISLFTHPSSSSRTLTRHLMEDVKLEPGSRVDGCFMEEAKCTKILNFVNCLHWKTASAIMT